MTKPSSPALPLSVNGQMRAFFGRRSGKRLHAGQGSLYQELLPALEIQLSGPFDPKTLFPQAKSIILEIGYGGGEHLALEASRHPQIGYIGCEVFTGGIGKMLNHIAEQGLENVRLFTDDALKLLVELPPASVDEVYLLYPDPWPKARHHKRRFVSAVTLDQLARVIRPGGKFHFASDIEGYAHWTLDHVGREKRFILPAAPPGAWNQPYPGWEPTRYENKARREGRLVSWYFSFERTP